MWRSVMIYIFYAYKFYQKKSFYICRRSNLDWRNIFRALRLCLNITTSYHIDKKIDCILKFVFSICKTKN